MQRANIAKIVLKKKTNLEVVQYQISLRVLRVCGKGARIDKQLNETDKQHTDSFLVT